MGRVAGRWRICAHASQPTAWGDAELTATLAARLAHQVDPARVGSLHAVLEDVPRIECASPLHPPRLGLVVVPSGGPTAVVRRAAEDAGWRVSEPVGREARSIADRFSALQRADVDAWLLVGRARPGERTRALEAARLIVAGEGTPGRPVVWAGSDVVGAELATVLGDRLVGRVPWLDRPDGGTVSARALGSGLPAAERLERALHELIETLAERQRRPTSAWLALRRATAELAQSSGLRILTVDVGANQAGWTLARGSAVAGRQAADGGLSSPSLTGPGRAAELAATMPFPVDELFVGDALKNAAARAGTVPETADELAVLHAAARDCLAAALADVAPIRDVDLVVASGRTLGGTPRLGDAAQLLVEGVRPLGVTHLAVDAAGVLPALGALAVRGERDLAEGLGALRQDLLIRLGAAVICRGGVPGEWSMRVRVLDGHRERVSLELRHGELEVVPLADDEEVELEVEIGEGVSLATPRPARAVRARVMGGRVGLVLDARDVPIVLPRRAEERQPILASWHERFVRERFPAAGA